MTKQCDNCQSYRVFLFTMPSGDKRYECKSCGAKVHTHPGTTEATGYMANTFVRQLRAEAHRVFDPLWVERWMTRDDAYKWMAETLDVPTDEAHISMLCESDLQHLIVCAQRRHKQLKRNAKKRENNYHAANRRKRALADRKRGSGWKDRRR